MLQHTSQEDLFITIKRRHRAASLALVATVGLTVLKLGAAMMSHSVGVLSEGVHSFLDLLSAAVSFFTVRQAVMPADENHPFGHGKIETLSSLFESLLLGVAAALIFYEAIQHWIHPAVIEHEGIAMAVILVSIIVSYAIYKHNFSAAKATESSALHVNALHFLSDVVASVGILVGLVLMKITGWAMIDPLIAMGVAVYILWVAVKQVKGALWELSDTQLPDHEVNQIRTLLNDLDGKAIESHDLRTRKGGSTRHIDFHLVVCGHMTVESSHSVCDELELKIQKTLPSSSVTIHVEPCEKEKTGCHVDCPHYKKRLVR